MIAELTLKWGPRLPGTPIIPHMPFALHTGILNMSRTILAHMCNMTDPGLAGKARIAGI